MIGEKKRKGVAGLCTVIVSKNCEWAGVGDVEQRMAGLEGAPHTVSSLSFLGGPRGGCVCVLRWDK